MVSRVSPLAVVSSRFGAATTTPASRSAPELLALDAQLGQHRVRVGADRPPRRLAHAPRRPAQLRARSPAR